MTRRSLIGAIVGLVAAAIVIGAVSIRRNGDDSPTFERASIEAEFSAQMRQRLVTQNANATMDELECLMDRDDLHWRCLTTARIRGQTYAITVSVVCDRETVRCLSEPATVVPTG